LIRNSGFVRDVGGVRGKFSFGTFLKHAGAFFKLCAMGLKGCGAATALSAGAGAIAQPRKARFAAFYAANAPGLRIPCDIFSALVSYPVFL
jgi:hypothetical protein